MGIRAQTAPSVGKRSALIRMGAALRYPNYRLLWLGSLSTSTGQWMQQVAMAWLALEMTNSAAWVGAVGFARGIPMLFFSLVGGVLADRMDRRRLLLAMQAIAGVLATVWTVAIVLDVANIWLLLAFSFLSGSALSIIFPTRQALAPTLVDRVDLPNAVAVNSATMNSARVIGPSIAGLVMAHIGAAGCFAIQAAGFLWALAMTARVRLPARPVDRRRGSALHSLAEGYRYIRSNREIQALLGLAAIPTVFGMPYVQMLPVIARNELGTGPEGAGLLLAATGVGAVVGSLLVAYFSNLRRKGAWLLAAATAFGAMLVVVSTARSLWTIIALLAVTGVAQAVYMALNNTLLQTIVPDAYRGRVMSVYMLCWGLMPLGTLPVGIVAQYYGAPVAVAIGGGICAAFSLLTALLRPVLRTLD